MNGRMAWIALVAALLVGVLAGRMLGGAPDPVPPQAAGQVRVVPAPAAAQPLATSPGDAMAGPAATGTPTGAGEPMADAATLRNALVALDNGPPPRKIYRCAALAGLLGEQRSQPERARFTALAADFGAVIAQIRGNPAAVVDELAAETAADEALAEPEAVLQATRDEAERVGSRRAEWLDNAWARCDQEVAWLEEVRSLLPARGAAASP